MQYMLARDSHLLPLGNIPSNHCNLSFVLSSACEELVFIIVVVFVWNGIPYGELRKNSLVVKLKKYLYLLTRRIIFKEIVTAHLIELFNSIAK